MHLLPPWPYYLGGVGHFLWGFYFCMKLKPIVIEAESPIISGPAAVLLGKIFHIPSIVEVRTSYFELIKQKVTFIPYSIKKKILGIVYVNTLKNASGVIANSKFYKQQLKDVGIESVEINPGLQKSEKRKVKSEKRKNSIVLGFLGRLEKEKGCHLVIQALGMLKKKYGLNNLKLLVAGNGSQSGELKELVKRLNLNDDVEFLGFVESFDALSRFDILVNATTVKAPLEMANVEAAEMGVPVVCFGDDDYPETVIDGKTGVKVKKINVNSLCDGAKKVINNEYKFEKKDFMRLVEKYSFEEQIKKLQDLFEKCEVI